MISIIIVNHNGEAHLAACLERLTALPPEPAHEVIVIDNASTDGSRALVEERFPRVHLLALEENVGFGAGNNRGAAAAQGAFLLLLNSDAWIDALSLQRLHATFAERPRLGLAAPQLRYPDGRLQFAWAPETGVMGETLQKMRNRFEARAWNHRLLPRLLRRLTGPGWYSAACVMVRRQAFEAIGGFDEEIFLYFEDVDLCRRLRLAGWQMALVPAAEAFHVKGGSQTSERSEMAYRRGQLYYYRKHRPAWEQGFLRWKLRRKFRRLPAGEQRRMLLGLLEP